MSDFSYALDLFILAHLWLIFTPILVVTLGIALAIFNAQRDAMSRIRARHDFKIACADSSADCRKPGCIHYS
jgi:uncharacterized membrane protein